MKIINIDKLQVGDIVLSTSTQKTSALIKAVTRSDISHAMICVSKGSVMDSTLDGVQARNVQKMPYDDDCAIYILRTKTPIPSEQLRKIVEYARSLTGTSYSLIASSKQYCSRMVARAYAEGGIRLVDNIDFCTPEALKKSSLLYLVEPAWIHVDEIDDCVFDSTEIMRKATNSLLAEVRALDSRVECLNDIDELVIRRSDLDQAVAAALRSSGYLDVWRVEEERFPWRYNHADMMHLYNSLNDKKALLEYCDYTVHSDTNGAFAHWGINLQMYVARNSLHPRKVFSLKIELYSNLCAKHILRLDVAKKIMAFHNENSGLHNK